jgi:dipeptidyl aminopeptidase/acylaminoacyl peptidase
VFARDARGREYLLFGRGGALQAQPFDSRRLKMTGEPFVVASQIGMMGPVPAVSVSDNGVLSYATDTSFLSTQVQLTWFDRQGTRLGTAGPPGAYPEFSLSPDEAHIAASRIGGDGSQDIVVIDRTQGGPATRFTFDPAPERSPVWSPDSTRIVFIRLNGGLFVKPFVGTGPEQQVIDRAGFPTDWSQDTIVYSADADVMFLSGGKASRFRETALEEYDARLSPDGAWIAYASGDSRPGSDVFVERVPASGFIRQISDGGVQPRWSADGRELFYIRPPRQLTARANTTGPADDGAVLMAVRLQLGDTPTFSAPVELFPIHPSAVSRGFGVARNGQRFLLPVSTAEGRPSPITISTNWAAD